ncbi:DUF4350 domain-containing protein [Candidatus Chloroploca sp. M-50]|uniref:DUF4350 domain-containing protein n=1 Tax=Candidatus Chloroploca mongolica TaxID=2528176 RepID=A0ABS4DFE2_9CHLR|nr:DUF4350 domain-containing protein [Candidatus Chloroploca mongolica]MBP1468172.1 DUF4350 domain-containing protein [Candidatus Chloroploca mongolica]
MIRRDLMLLVVLFAGLVALIGLGPGRSEGLPGGNGSSRSSEAGGTLALYRWLGSLGYRVERLEYRAFEVDPRVDLLVVFNPRERYSRDDAAAVAAWVEAGGTLLIVEPRSGLNAPAASLLEAFDLKVEPLPAEGAFGRAPILQPALGAPAATQLNVQTRSMITSERTDLAPLAGSNATPVMIGVQHGEGYIFAITSAQPFSNRGLRERDHAAVVVNMLRRIPPGGTVVFDEIHHGFLVEPSMRTLLLGTPWGWATLYLGGIVAGYLVLTGRRFGQPIPLRAEADRRSSAEYLASMAGLLRRAGKREYLRDHYRATLRRHLTHSYGLSPDCDDATLLATIKAVHPALAENVRDLLNRLNDPATDEASLLQIVAAIDGVRNTN